MAHNTLKDLLAKFLKSEVIGKYPTVETHILSLNPLQITDDYVRFIDVSSLEDRVMDELEGSDPTQAHVLVLQDWKFVLRRIPNSHEYFFDLNVNKFSLKPEAHPTKPEIEPIKMEDDDQIRYHFENRKRQEIEKMLRAAGAPSRSDGDTSRKSPAKATTQKSEIAPTAVQSTNISEAKQMIGALSTEDYAKIMRKPSNSKVEEKKHPANLETSFFKKAGVLSATSKYLTEDSLFFSIAELMSVPAFVPQVKRSVIRMMPSIRVRRSNSSESGVLEENLRESHARLVVRSSHEKRAKAPFDFEDIHDFLKTGQIRWDQMTFTRSAFDYLRRNQMLLEQAD